MFTYTQKRLSVKFQTIATFVAVIFAVALPQVFHILGRAMGISTSLGEIFLPMHLPIIVVGLLAGPYAGACAGIISPIMAHILTGMPTIEMLPFMMIEVFAYGLTAGLLRQSSIPFIGKTLIVQLAGRVLKAVAICISVYIIGNSSIAAASIFTSISKGIIGIALQLILIPLIFKNNANTVDQ